MASSSPSTSVIRVYLGGRIINVTKCMDIYKYKDRDGDWWLIFKVSSDSKAEMNFASLEEAQKELLYIEAALKLFYDKPPVATMAAQEVGKA